MKKYNIALTIVFTIFIAVIFGYIYFIDKIYQDKIVQKQIQALDVIYQKASKPIISDLSQEELAKEKENLDFILKKLSINATIQENKGLFIISGKIDNTGDYVLIKKFIDIVENTNYICNNICIGKNCTKDLFGFSLTIKPFKTTPKN